MAGRESVAATVHSANGGGVLYSLTRNDFVPAVSGSASSSAAADEVVAARLATSPKPLGFVR